MKTLAGAAIAAALCLAGAAHAIERAAALHSDIRVAASGELTVTETIEVEAAAGAAGLVRDFAAEHRDRAGRRVRVPLALDRVLRNGAPEPYALERHAGGARLRTGGGGRALARGKQVYEIVYRTARQVGATDEAHELYWNVGRGWSLGFERVSAEVRFERPVSAQEMKLDATTGAPGARGQDFHAFVREGSAAFRATRPLSPGEGMTIAVAFPKGVLAEPPIDRAIPVGGATLALVIAFLCVCRARSRRKPLAPRAAPPEGVGPGGVRFIARKGYDERCASAALLGLQSRGYVRIREHGERFRLEPCGKTVAWFPGEEALARRLLRDPGAELRRNGRAVEEAGRAFAAELEQAFGARAWTRNGSFALAAAGIGAAGVLAMLALDAPREQAALVAAALVLIIALFAVWWLPVYRRRGVEHEAEIEALRAHLAGAEPRTREEYLRLLPYAVALELEAVWSRRFAETAPSSLIELVPRAQDKAPALPRRPSRHSRSAAA